jgi:uncharacterized phage infection (PIP) family protein YhgE
MSFPNDLGRLSPTTNLYPYPMSPLTRSASQEWRAMLRAHEASIATFGNPATQPSLEMPLAAPIEQYPQLSVPAAAAPVQQDLAPAAEIPAEDELSSDEANGKNGAPEEDSEVQASTKRTRKRHKVETSSSDELDPKERRRIKNREAARKSRQNKKIQAEQLINENDNLKEKVKNLMQTLSASRQTIMSLSKKVEDLSAEINALKASHLQDL